MKFGQDFERMQSIGLLGLVSDRGPSVTPLMGHEGAWQVAGVSL